MYTQGIEHHLSYGHAHTEHVFLAHQRGADRQTRIELVQGIVHSEPAPVRAFCLDLNIRHGLTLFYSSLMLVIMLYLSISFPLRHSGSVRRYMVELEKTGTLPHSFVLDLPHDLWNPESCKHLSLLPTALFCKCKYIYFLKKKSRNLLPGMPISAGSRYHDELIFTAVRIAASRCLASTLIHLRAGSFPPTKNFVSFSLHFLLSGRRHRTVCLPRLISMQRVCVWKSCCACLCRSVFPFRVDVPWPVGIPISCLYCGERLNAFSPLCTCYASAEQNRVAREGHPSGGREHTNNR
jgi:hypothetical protein